MWRLRLVLYIVLLFTSVPTFAQQEFGTRFIPAHDVWFKVGDWTWFTYHGTLFRKHDASAVAEVWYGPRLNNVRDKGATFDSSALAYHRYYTSANSSLPPGPILSIKFHSDGSIWFASVYGGVAHLDAYGWTVHQVKADSLWPAGSPFERTRLGCLKTDNDSFPEYLSKSVPRRSCAVWGGCAVRSYPPVFDLVRHSSGAFYLATEGGVHVFSPLAEGESSPLSNPNAQAPYPNPASSTATFAMQSDVVKKMTIDIRDLTGRLRLQNVEGTTQSTVVDVTGLEEGVYVAVMRSDGANAKTTFTVRR